MGSAGGTLPTRDSEERGGAGGSAPSGLGLDSAGRSCPPFARLLLLPGRLWASGTAFLFHRTDCPRRSRGGARSPFPPHWVSLLAQRSRRRQRRLLEQACSSRHRCRHGHEGGPHWRSVLGAGPLRRVSRWGRWDLWSFCFYATSARLPEACFEPASWNLAESVSGANACLPSLGFVASALGRDGGEDCSVLPRE